MSCKNCENHHPEHMGAKPYVVDRGTHRSSNSYVSTHVELSRQDSLLFVRDCWERCLHKRHFFE